ncbi:sensor histidine kinase [Paenacidovorax caeni]|uniref:sensor histidine kinase n=1 Tax=Paenacidovorax caeni TaxID=343013 RepID=UPI00130ED3D4|nr:7TM-DISM domain-containing protein [Paenacidovorax caeni]
MDLVEQRSYLEDPEGVLSIADIERAQGWQTFEGPLPLRNKGIPFWVRLQLRQPPPGIWVIRVQPSLLQDIQIFQRAIDGAWEVQHFGTRHAYHGRERGELAFSVPYRSSPGDDATVFVRVHSANTIAHFTVISTEESQEFDIRTHVLLGLYMGFSVVVMCLSLFAWRVTREPLWGLNAGFDLATFVLVGLQMGLVAKYLLPDSVGVLNQLTLYANSIHFAWACLLFRAILPLFNVPAWCTLVYTVCVGLLPVQLLLISLGQGAQAMALNNLGMLCVTLWGGVVVWFASIEDRTLRLLFKTLSICLVAYLLLWLMPAIAPLPLLSNVSLYPTLPSNAFTMFMALLIMARHTQLKLQHQTALEQQKHATDAALRYEKQRHAETSSFLSMVLHELKNPLSLLRVAIQHLQRTPDAQPEDRGARLTKMQRAVDNIDAILERCVAVDYLEQGALTVQPDHEDLTALLVQCAENTAQAQRIRLELPANVQLQVDGALLRLMVRNLLDNALRYGDPHSPVTLRLDVLETSVHIKVCNAPGRAGWPEPEKLFQKYYRASSALFCSGTGLGLYWVAQVACLMRATVRYVPDSQHIVFELCLNR